MPFEVLRDAVAHLHVRVESRAVVLQRVDDAEALFVVVESRLASSECDDALAGVAKRRVAEIVAERDGLW